MRSYCERLISSDGTYLHSFFGLLLAWGNKIRCTRSYLCPGLIFRIIQRKSEKEISSDDAYFHALFELLMAWSSTRRCSRFYF